MDSQPLVDFISKSTTRKALKLHSSKAPGALNKMRALFSFDTR